MKVGIITSLYPPLIKGGAEIIASMQVSGFKEAMHHVFVISTKPYNYLGRKGFKIKEDINNTTVYRFFPFNIYHYMDGYKFPGFIRLIWHIIDIFNISSYFITKKILEEEKPNVIITHNLMGLGFLIPRLLKKLGIKHVHVVHDVQLVAPSGLIIKGKEDSWKHKIFRKIGYVNLMRNIMGNPDIVVSPSKFLMDYYKKNKFFKKSKKFVLPNPLKQLIKFEKKPNKDLNILYLGQLYEAKGALGLIKTFNELKFKNSYLHIVGSGLDTEKAVKLARGNKKIIFHGWKSGKELLAVLASADLLVAPSLCYENSPNVIYEALSMGIPVLTSRIGGAGELIVEDKNGWTFPAGRFDLLKKKLHSLYKQRDKLASMADNCRRSVSGLILRKYINNLLDIIDEN